ncbi:hypothetical protein [Flavobacterium sp. SM2513]|uniref:hypothetical protein n=1 Tax=Flavobacterium sp. SM2513 TaxID=3424766 RepID=UPI003D7F32D7
MYTINSDKTLAEAIRNLEAQSALELEILKKHTEYTLHELNPVNIVKEKFQEGISNLGETVSSTGFKNGLLKTGIGLASGFLTRKLMLGPKAGIFKKLFATAVQAAVSGFVINKLPDEEEERRF